MFNKIMTHIRLKFKETLKQTYKSVLYVFSKTERTRRRELNRLKSQLMKKGDIVFYWNAYNKFDKKFSHPFTKKYTGLFKVLEDIKPIRNVSFLHPELSSTFKLQSPDGVIAEYYPNMFRKATKEQEKQWQELTLKKGH